MQQLLMKQFLLIVLFLFLYGGVRLSAQFGGACPPGQVQSAPFCQSACVACDFANGFEDNTFLSLGAPIDLNCANGGSITLNNPRWYAFIAGQLSPFIPVSLNIKALQCQGASTLEVAIMDACPGGGSGPPPTALACATINAGNSNITVSGLTPGQIYYLVVDANGSQCKFTVQVAQGDLVPPPLGPLGSIEGITAICPKAKLKYSVTPVANATSYTWTSPPGSKINGGTNVVTIPVVAGSGAGGPIPHAVDIEFGNFGGNICVTVNSPCDTPKTTCITVTSQAIPITVLDEEIICYEELPFVWSQAPNTTIVAPGTYTLTSTPYQSYLGCDSVVRQRIVVRPLKYRIIPNIYLCQPNCYSLNGFDFCESGTYVETLTTPEGCDSTINFTIIKIPVQAAAQVRDTLTCAKTSVLLTSEGSSKGNTVFYAWFNSSGQNISNADTALATAPGEYTLIVTNFGGGGNACKDTATVVVVANTTPPLSNAGPDRVLSCAQAVIQLQGSGSVGPQYTYQWVATNGGNIVSGAATLTPTVNAPGLYILYVTNNLNGCVSFDVTKVTAETLPPTASAQGGTFTCLQPTVTLQSTTNAVNPTFSWTGPGGFTSNQQNPTVNAGGEYVVVVTDGNNGCTTTATATVIANTQPPGASAAGDTLTCVVNEVALSGGSPASNPSFAWAGPNGFTSNQQNPTVTTPGTYTLTVTGPNGCTSTATAVVALNNALPGASLAPSANLNCNNASINLVATSNPPASVLNFNWTNPDGSTTNTGNNPVLSVNQPGAYTVVVTNTINGCTSTANATVIQNPNVTAVATANNVTCNGAQNGSASVTPGGGNNTYTYLWNTGANTPNISNLGAGTYTVTVTDGENCTASTSVTITQPALLLANASATPQTANGTIDGTATAAPTGGTPTYSFNWNTGGTTATITDLLPGNYSVTVTDINGCTAVAVVTVNAYNCTMAATIQGQDVSCADANDGVATITVNAGEAPYTYSWNTGAETSTIENLGPGSYSATATDAAGCPVELLIQITEPDTLLANATKTNSSGPATNDGTATAGPTGGTEPYTYEWNTGETTQGITGLGAGIYTVTVTDANGCTAVQSVEVEAGNCGLLTNFLSTNPTCNGSTNGEATVLITGGVGPFTYEWSSGGTNATETGLGAGDYTVSITDANGCEVTDDVTLTEPEALTIEVEEANTTDCVNSPNGSATVSVGGGTGDISIAWNNGQTGPTATGLVAGTFIATATDDNGCTITASVTIEAVDEESPVITGAPIDVPLGPTGTVTLTPQILGVTVTDNCVVSSVTVQPTNFNCLTLGEHIITVTATDDSGNTSTATVVANIIDNSPPTTECPPSIVRCFGDNVVQYSAPVATDNCLGNGGFWALTEGLPSGATFPLGVTTNTYTYTDAGGNPGSCSFEVTILTQVTATATITDDVDNQNIGAINLTVGGGLPPYTFQWTKDGAPFADTEDLTNIGMGVYTVVVTDAAGCLSQVYSFEVKSLVNTKDPSWASGLSIRPNPTSGHVVVIFPDGLNKEVVLTVFDVTGRRVVEQIATAPKQMDLDLTALPSGVYPIMLRVGNEMIARRIVVNK